MTKKEAKKPTQWHDWLGTLLIEVLTAEPEEQKYGLEQLRQMGITNKFSAELSRFLAGLWSQLLLGGNMEVQFTPDQVMEIGQMWGDVYLHNLPPEKRVAGLKPEERVAGLKLEEVFSYYKPEEIEAYLRSIQRLSNGA